MAKVDFFDFILFVGVGCDLGDRTSFLEVQLKDFRPVR